MERDDSLALTSIPPKYRYICPNCGETEADTYPPEINVVKQELTLEDLIKYREELDNWDWEKYRREAAKDILCALCSFPPINYKEDVRQAINIADELTKQLKEEEQK